MSQGLERKELKDEEDPPKTYSDWCIRYYPGALEFIPLGTPRDANDAARHKKIRESEGAHYWEEVLAFERYKKSGLPWSESFDRKIYGVRRV